MGKIKKVLGVFILSMVLFIPGVLADDMSDAFKKALTDGKLVIDSVPPRTEDEAYFIVSELPFYELDQTYKYDEKDGYFMIDISTCNDDYTVCDLSLNNFNGPGSETHEVEIVYNYDANIYSRLSSMFETFNVDDDIVYTISDLELINYWMNITSDADDNLDNYSLALKSDLNYINTDFYISNRAGDDTDFYNLRRGIAIFSYNGIVYHINSFLGTEASNIIYVNDDTTSTKEAILEAAIKRIKDYSGKEYEVEYVGLASEWKEEFIHNMYNYMTQWDNDLANLGYEGWKASTDYYTDPTVIRLSFLDTAAGDYYFKVTINDIEHYFIVVKNSALMLDPSVKTLDLETDVSVASSSNKLPLDTTISASILTSGEEYENIKKVINNDNSVTYNITLHSNTLNSNVTELEDGTFEVSIPLSDSFNGKKLIVYFVKDDNTIEEHEVEVQDGYAKFATNHFSAYTLAVVDTPSNITNPNTLDNISVSFVIGGMAILVIIGATLYLKKETN